MPKNYTKDYNKNPKKRSDGRGGSMFVGILIGLVLGLAIALGVAWYINKMPNPFREKPQAPPSPKAESAKAAPAKAADPGPPVADKGPRFTFPEILKGDGSAEKSAGKSDKGEKSEKASTQGPREAFYLQAGSFQNAPDADNLKARLALVGIEAAIQTTNLPDKGVWHRVRIGPYSDVEELNRVRSVLKQNGVDAALVKVREAEK
ncbi:MAG: SPOR domain-containing protein [Burkholderiales bacterium]